MRYVAPHAETFRRALGAIDVEALNGKSPRGALREDGRCVHLFSAMVHSSGIVVGQNEVDEKSNEITALGWALGDPQQGALREGLDWTFDDYQMRASGSRPRALATLDNPAISLLRLAGAANIAASTRWVSRDATRAAARLGV